MPHPAPVTAAAPEGAVSDERLQARAAEVLRTEAGAVLDLVATIDAGFAAACRMILACHGRVVVSGMGKSGHVARKIAATLASTGTPAMFVHPAEASHGDLGMIKPVDLVLAISNGGESDEIIAILPVLKRQGVTVVAMTGNAASSLARHADIVLDSGVEKEACPLQLAPTASTTAQLALGDALAVALLDARGFRTEDFARSHPGGALGRKLLTHVSDVMRTGKDLPSVPDSASLKQAVLEMSRGRMGMTAVLDPAGRVRGIFTDGDLRRGLERVADFGAARVAELMSANPRVIRPEALAVEAVRVMEHHKVNQLLVVDEAGTLVGALNMHDLFRARVI